MFAALALPLLLGASPAQAQQSFMLCQDNHDGTITCRADYAPHTHTSGAAERLLVKDLRGATLIDARLAAEHSVTFERPRRDFMMILIRDEVERMQRIELASLTSR